MARRKRSTAEEAPRSFGGSLAEAFPASPGRPPKFGLYCVNAQGHHSYEAFAAAFAARRFLDIVTEGEYKWLNHCTILSESGIRISSTSNPNPKQDEQLFELDELVEYELNEAEREWVPPEPYFTRWHSYSRTREPEEREAPARRTAPVARRTAGNVTAGAIADELGLEARQVRAALRKAKLVKPAAGWEWPPEEAERIKRLIKEHSK